MKNNKNFDQVSLKLRNKLMVREMFKIRGGDGGDPPPPPPPPPEGENG